MLPEKLTKKQAALLTAACILLVAAGAGLFAFRSEENSGFEKTTFSMGSPVQQTVYGRNRESAATAAAQNVQQLDDLLSWRTESSDVARLNSEAGVDWIRISPKTARVLQISLDVAQKSGGAFEPTILPISSLWDFGGENQHLPSREDIARFLPYVDYRNLRVDTQESSASLKLHGMAIDLGGIGKGAACDEACAAYKAAGVQGAVVAVGGSVGVYGQKPDRTPWHIAVRDPASPEAQSAAMGQVDLSSGFISTSGTYEKNFTVNGVTYHHLLNPKTGYPENNGLVSVTVWADNGAVSDALSTACFVLGREKGMALLAQYKAGGIFIDSKNRVYVTENLKSRFTITNKKYAFTA